METIDPRLNQIDDCLYRVAIRILIVQQDQVLLVHELPDKWWAFPGGGVDHGETIEQCLTREIEEELGVPAGKVSSDFQMVHFTIGAVVNSIPRMNLYFKASVPESQLKDTNQVTKWAWFTKEEFLELDMNPSYDKSELAEVMFLSDPAHHS